MDRTTWKARAAHGASRSEDAFRPARLRQLIGLVVLALLFGPAPVGVGRAGADDQVFALKLVDGKFDPAEVVVPADTPFQLQVTNGGIAAIEFESFELHRERVVQPGETITVYLPALKAGSYPFFDDFHKETTQGAIVSK
jgi:hypothetical protein